MRSWLLAFDNLRFNGAKTVLSVILIGLATTSILVMRGYVNFTSEGLRNGFIGQSGAFQIAYRSYWANDEENLPLLKSEDREIIMNAVNQLDGVSETTEMLSFNGLVGTAARSTFFSGTAYETYPNGLYQRVKKESIGRLDPNGMVLGVSILDYLHIKEGDTVTLFGQSDYGIAMSTLPVVGTVDLGDRNLNKVVAFSSLQAVRDFYGMIDEFDRIRVDIANVDDIPALYSNVNKLLEGTPYEAKDWEYHNPYYTDVHKYTNNNAFWNTVIIVVLIVVAISQMLQMSYLQRMRELGTLQAIGLTPGTVFSLLIKETIILSTVSIVVGLLLGYFIRFILIAMGAAFTPPMSTESYNLVLIYNFADILWISIGIVLVTMLSSLYPTYKATSKTVVEVMRYV